MRPVPEITTPQWGKRFHRSDRQSVGGHKKEQRPGFEIRPLCLAKHEAGAQPNTGSRWQGYFDIFFFFDFFVAMAHFLLV
jgi:hypothetical protein